MFESTDDQRMREIRQGIAASLSNLKRRMNSEEIMIAIGLKFRPGDRALICAALSSLGMADCVTHIAGKFDFNPA